MNWASINKIDHHDIAEILLKVALNTIKKMLAKIRRQFFLFIQFYLVQIRHHHHFIECNIFSRWYSWKNAHFGIKQQSLKAVPIHLFVIQCFYHLLIFPHLFINSLWPTFYISTPLQLKQFWSEYLLPKKVEFQ
jgi:hypothetical protein